MTRFRLAAIAALSLVALLVTATGGEAQRPPRGHRGRPTERGTPKTTCKTAQGGAGDFAKIKSEVARLHRPRPPRARRRRFVPVEDVKVVVKLKDKTPQNGNNVVDAKDSDLTNDNGVAKTKVEFDNFGNYRVIVKVKVGGEVVDEGHDQLRRRGPREREVRRAADRQASVVDGSSPVAR